MQLMPKINDQILCNNIIDSFCKFKQNCFEIGLHKEIFNYILKLIPYISRNYYNFYHTRADYPNIGYVERSFFLINLLEKNGIIKFNAYNIINCTPFVELCTKYYYKARLDRYIIK